MSSSQPTSDHVAFPLSGQGVPHVTAFSRGFSRGRGRPHPVVTSSRGRGRSGAAPCKMPPVPQDMSPYAALPASMGEGGGFTLAQPDFRQNKPAVTQLEMTQADQGNAVTATGAQPAAKRQAAATAPSPSQGSGCSGSNIFSGLNQTNTGMWTARYHRNVIGTFTTAEAAQHAYSTVRKAATDSGLPVRFTKSKFLEIFDKAVREVREAALGDGCLVASEPPGESIATTGSGTAKEYQAERATGNAPSQGGKATRARSCYVQQNRSGKWTATFSITGTRRWIGTFTTAEAASQAFETVQNAFEGCTLNKYDLKRMEIFEKAKKEARDAALVNGCLTTKVQKSTESKVRPVNANNSNPLQGCYQSPHTGAWHVKFIGKVIGTFTTAEAAQYAYETVQTAITASGLSANDPKRNEVFEEAKKSVQEAALADGCLVQKGVRIKKDSVPTVLDTADITTESIEGEGQVPGDSLRTGQWTPEEKEYAKKVIADFHAGVLRAPPGTRLRKYLSEKLNCDPMRISKKFEGELGAGNHNFQALPRTVDYTADIDEAQSELDELEKMWRKRLERDGIGKKAKRNRAVIYKNMAIHKAVVEAAAKASESYQKAREESAAAAVAVGGDAAKAKKEARDAALASGCIIETLSPTPNIQVNAADIPVEATKYEANAKKRGRGRPRQNVDPFVGPFEEPSKRRCRPRESVDPRIEMARQTLAMQKQPAGPVEIAVHGRFVKKDDKAGGLYEIGDAISEFEAAQALREGLDIGATKRNSDCAAQKESAVSVDGDMPDVGSTNMEVRKEQFSSHFAKTNGITDDVAELAASILAERDAQMKIDAPSVVPVPVHVDLDLEGVQGDYRYELDGSMEEGLEEWDEWTSEVAEV